MGALSDVAIEFTPHELRVGSVVFGGFIGVSYFVAWHALQQTTSFNLYTFLIWFTFSGNVMFMVSSYCFVYGLFGNNKIVTLVFMCLGWAIVTQGTIHIILNRLLLLYGDKKTKSWFKIAVSTLLIMVGCCVIALWLCAAFGVSHQTIKANRVFEYFEKAFFLIIDSALNYLFIKTIKERLIKLGLTKYDALVSRNTKTVILSICLYAMLIGLMIWDKGFNSALYVLFVSLVFMIKLNIELSLSELMVQVVSAKPSTYKSNATNNTHGELRTFDGIAVTTHTAIKYEDMDDDPTEVKRKGDMFRKKAEIQKKRGLGTRSKHSQLLSNRTCRTI